MTASEDGTRERLRALRLTVLVRDHTGAAPGSSAVAFGPGAGLVDGGVAWVHVDDEPGRGLGPAIAWARRHGASSLQLLADRETGLLARRAGELAWPVTVWHVEERTLLPAIVEPLWPPPPPPAAHVELVPTIEAGGARPNVEHGVVTGEVYGLEVCRVVADPVTGAVRLDVGVGAHDREAFALMHGDVPTVDALRRVVAAVAEHRRPDGPPHPLHRLVPERLLRWQLEVEPVRIGLASLEPAQPPVPRPNVKVRVPCSALGRRADGTAVVVVCSVGVDLDVVPYATDARLAAALGAGDGPDVDADGPETMIVVPPRDLIPMTAELVGLARHAVTVIAHPRFS